MSHVAYISHRLDKIIVEAPRNPNWAAAINYIIPPQYRKVKDGIWYFAEMWYDAVREITKFYHPHYHDGANNYIPIITSDVTNGWENTWLQFMQKQDEHRHRPIVTIRSNADTYDVLYLKSNAPPEVVTAAHRALSKLHHPDAGGDPNEFKRIQNAYEEISSSTR